jgi:hypothetical protein
MTRKNASDVFADTAREGAEATGAVLGRPWGPADQAERVIAQPEPARNVPAGSAEVAAAPSAASVVTPEADPVNGPFGPEPRRWRAPSPKKAPKRPAPSRKKPVPARRNPGRQASPVPTMPRREVRIPEVVFQRQEIVSEATGLPPMEALWMLAHLGWRQWTRDEQNIEVSP